MLHFWIIFLPPGPRSCHLSYSISHHFPPSCQPSPPPPPPLPSKGKGRGEGRLGQGGRGRSKGGEKPMGTTAYGGKGSKGRAANGDRPVGAASCRRDHHTMASCQNPPSPSWIEAFGVGNGYLFDGRGGGWWGPVARGHRLLCHGAAADG